MKNRILLLLMLMPTLAAMNPNDYKKDFEYIELDVRGYRSRDTDEDELSDLPVAISRDLIPKSPETIHRDRKKSCKKIIRWTLEATPYVLFFSTLAVEASRIYITKEQLNQADVMLTYSLAGISVLKSIVDLGRVIRWRHRILNT